MGSIWFIVESAVYIIHKKELFVFREGCYGDWLVLNKSHLYDGKGLDINRKCDLRDFIFFLCSLTDECIKLIHCSE